MKRGGLRESLGMGRDGLGFPYEHSVHLRCEKCVYLSPEGGGLGGERV